MPQAKLIHWVLLLSLAMIWGASFMSVTTALGSFPPYTIAAIRLSLGAAALYALMRLRGGRLPKLSDPDGLRIWGFMIAMGLFSNALPFSLLGWAQSYVASGFAGVSMAAVPLFVLPLAHFFVVGESLTLRRVISFALGFSGVVILIGPAAFSSSGTDFETLARVTCILSALCYAIGGIITRLCPKTDLITLATGALLTGAIMATPLALIFEGVPRNISPLPVLAVVYLGLLPTAAAQILLTKIIRDVGPSFLSLVNFQVPIWSIIFGALFLSETLPSETFIALALILIGMAVMQWQVIRGLIWRKPPATK